MRIVYSSIAAFGWSLGLAFRRISCTEVLQVYIWALWRYYRVELSLELTLQ
jgi:hypothetical protein